jgi:hypothetical protein
MRGTQRFTCPTGSLCNHTHGCRRHRAPSALRDRSPPGGHHHLRCLADGLGLGLDHRIQPRAPCVEKCSLQYPIERSTGRHSTRPRVHSRRRAGVRVAAVCRRLHTFGWLLGQCGLHYTRACHWRPCLPRFISLWISSSSDHLDLALYHPAAHMAAHDARPAAHPPALRPLLDSLVRNRRDCSL